MKFACAHCSGRGWTEGKEWANKCLTCNGRSAFSTGTLGKLFKTDPRTIVKINDLRARPKTAARFFDQVITLVG